MSDQIEEAPPALVERLERSRTLLLEALAERTEQDFARPLGGEDEETMGHALAALAQAERQDLAAARSVPVPDRELPERPLPPQLTHDLAGARHQTLTQLPHLETDAAAALVEAVSARETELAARIVAAIGSAAAG